MLQNQSILITGGTGSFGHTFVPMTLAKYNPRRLVIYSRDEMKQWEMAKLYGDDERVRFFIGDVRDKDRLARALNGIDYVVHAAATKIVPTAEYNPFECVKTNVFGAMNLIDACITEDFPRSHINPYGHTKLVCEDMLVDMRVANPSWRTGVLRYFNPVGAHPSGLIGEDPAGTPNNLMPYVAQVAVGKRPFLNVYGNDYDTPDGTGVRDYIHVQDLAQAHVAAVQSLLHGADSFTVNVGSGQGHSVMEVVRSFEHASGNPVPYQFAPRRVGDVAKCYADATLAQELLGWRAKHTLANMCTDAWRWQSNNPDGYV